MDMERTEPDWETVIRNTTEILRKATAEVDAMTAKLKEQNRKARFVAQCMGLDL